MKGVEEGVGVGADAVPVAVGEGEGGGRSGESEAGKVGVRRVKSLLGSERQRVAAGNEEEETELGPHRERPRRPRAGSVPVVDHAGRS